jgi:hypothetical protein
LAAVYVELVSERQSALQLDPIAAARVIRLAIAKRLPAPLPPRVTADDRARIGRSWKRSAPRLFGLTTWRAVEDLPVPPDMMLTCQ